MASERAAVIVDIVDSKQIADRASAQGALERAFAGVDEIVPGISPLEATVGDEFQAAYPSLGSALEATLAARLALPEGLDCRFGIGWGELREVGRGTRGAVQDGSAWWHARAAIDQAHQREDSRTPTLRSWFAGDVDSRLEATVNAYLLTRDHVVSSMNPRARRLAYGTLRGRLQAELAEKEGISQGAVSQALRRSGGINVLTATAALRAAL
ncbi:SatD family protein [Herbiconiux sp. CPCC 205716]|uniref:SatD family protein n=1 Tax=Herbiconiux gentiana TaxID=2970912 RepID=A0ABT2GH88_9MICO|nr:SatD family protein [Herbiconiux gentiana]MCS5714962.1 SatD family protein [Herbiconiux gentiana]